MRKKGIFPDLCAQILCLINADFKKIVMKKNNEKISTLIEADKDNKA